jgi:DNA replication protein DnaC
MADAAEKFAGRWFRNNPAPALLVLAGENGTGKSHTGRRLSEFARASSFSAWERGGWKGCLPSATFCHWPEIVDGFKAGNYAAVSDYFSTSLLVLDDVGAEHDPSRNGVDKLCQILSRRENKFTVVTTNIAPSHWPERFDNRIADRLMRNSEVRQLFQVESFALSAR